MWNRWYEPKLGRFISRDPIGFEGGINLYGYAENSPVNFIDPDGEFAVPVVPHPAVIGAALVFAWWSGTPGGKKAIEGLAAALGGSAGGGTAPCPKNAEEHTKNKRPSTKGKHEKGQATHERNKFGGEKGDVNRRQRGETEHHRKERIGRLKNVY